MRQVWHGHGHDARETVPPLISQHPFITLTPQVSPRKERPGVNTLSNMDNFEEILIQGINFSGGSRGAKKDDDDKVKTKAKKKKYITGAHGSGSARQKAKYREQRANRHK